MISLDQVLLLQDKVESAVAKIKQLQEENDALRRKCLELTNALSSKSEQLSVFENDQNKIEEGIRSALSRLNSIENSVLKSAGQTAPNFNTMATLKVEEQKSPSVEATIKPQVVEKPYIEETVSTPVPFVEDIPDEISNEIPEDSGMLEIDDTILDTPISELSAKKSVPQASDFTLDDDISNAFEADFSDADDEENPQDNIGFDIF